MSARESIDEFVQRRLLEEARATETQLVEAARSGERSVDIRLADGSHVRYLLPKTRLGRWWQLRRAGYRMKP